MVFGAWFLGRPEIADLGGLCGPGDWENPAKNLRVPVGPKNMHSKLECKASGPSAAVAVKPAAMAKPPPQLQLALGPATIKRLEERLVKIVVGMVA